VASSAAPVHPYRYLTLFLVLLIGAYLLVFLTGDKQAKPKLGIDLQGGTRVTLTARTPDGSAPTREALMQAQQIIGARVNGLGVSGSEVVIDGDNLVITVPGNDGNEARNLGQTARLYVRPVVRAFPVSQLVNAQAQQGQPGQGQPPGAPAPGAPVPGAPVPGAPAPAGQAPPAEPAPAEQSPATGGSTPQPRPYPQEPAPTPTPPPPPAPGAPAPPAGAPAPAAPGPPDARKDLSERIKFEKQLRQSTNQNLQILAIQYQAGRCGQEDVLAGNDDPNLPLVTCSTDHQTVYMLDKSIISGEQIENATSGFDQQATRYVVDLQF
jgi:preprotein translocase subunit SecD